MKILVIPYTYPDEEKPNITPFIRVNTVAIKKLGHQVDVLQVKMLPLRQWLHRKTGNIQTHLDDAIKRWSIYMRYVHRIDRWNTYIFKKKAKKLYEEYVKLNGTPDVIISHFYHYAGYAAQCIAREYSVPFLHIEHAGWLLGESLSKYETEKLKQVVGNADCCVCVSEELKKAVLLKTGISEKVIVIPNMIDADYRFCAPLEKENYVFFSAGNLYEGKRFPLLIQAFCEVFDKGENVELRIAGEGHLRPVLQKMIADNKREKQIKLLGSLDKQSMLKEYQYCDSFVLPSEHETFGIVYREALFVGRPIITTNHQGFRHDWSEDYGIRIDIDNPEQLKAALKKMRSHSGEYHGVAISEQCQAMYSEEKVVGQYADLLKKLGKNGNR